MYLAELFYILLNFLHVFTFYAFGIFMHFYALFFNIMNLA